MQEEVGRARRIREAAHETINNIMDDVRVGKALSVTGIRETADAMIATIVRNPDAFMWLSRLKEKDSYTYTHSIDSCALSVAFGRHLGLPKVELQQLAIGALLFDIGKMKLPAELLSKPGPLTETEFELVKAHVAYSVGVMGMSKGISEKSIRLTLHHHERLQGGGYPSGLRSNQISLYGRIAGIVDCYDAMTSDAPYRIAVSTDEALRMLYGWRNVHFQDDLVEQFIQCIGAYPTGTIVELSTGEIGIVVAQNRVRRLRPQVMLILDAEKRDLSSGPTLDLLTQTTNEQGEPLEIIKALAPGSHGIDPSEFYL
jgi:HD-GYP domain-containing protein (c-di-GMP phosphodiesterase class II)